MSHNFKVSYAFERMDTDNLPENERWGFGTMNINTDIIPETAEDYKEIARTIGKQGGYKTVAVQALSEKPNTDNIQPFVEGEVIG